MPYTANFSMVPPLYSYGSTYRYDTLQLSTGTAALELPNVLTSEDADALRAWIERKITGSIDRKLEEIVKVVRRRGKKS